MHDAWNNWGNDLGTFAASLTEPERSACYAEAERVLLQAELLHSDNVYNLACVYAMTQRLDEARVKLLHCKDKGTLPDAEHLANDHDLDPVRDLPWFADLLKPWILWVEAIRFTKVWLDGSNTYKMSFVALCHWIHGRLNLNFFRNWMPYEPLFIWTQNRFCLPRLP